MVDVGDKCRVHGDERSEPAANANKLKRLTKKIAGLFTKGKARHEIADALKEISNQTQAVADRHVRYNVGGTVLRLAKDLAENNRGARVLVVCSEITAVTFRGTHESHLDSMLVKSLFGDGAAAVIIGADPDESIERPLFQLVSTSQMILPDSEGAIDGHLREVGLTFHLLKDVPGLISKNIERALEDAFKPLGIDDWNSVFWIAHPGGPAILDMVEAKVNLNKERMRATRHVLSEYGNMSSACVLFIMDEMRKRSAEDGHTTTGEGMDWGVLFGFGPGLTVETVVLHSVPVTA